MDQDPIYYHSLGAVPTVQDGRLKRTKPTNATQNTEEHPARSAWGREIKAKQDRGERVTKGASAPPRCRRNSVDGGGSPGRHRNQEEIEDRDSDVTG